MDLFNVINDFKVGIYNCFWILFWMEEDDDLNSLDE